MALIVELGSWRWRLGVAGEWCPRVECAPLCSATDVRSWSSGDLVASLRPKLGDLVVTSLAYRAKDSVAIVVEGVSVPRGVTSGVVKALLQLHGFESVKICPSPAVALWTTGCTAGLVLDIGCNDSRAVAVYDGQIIQHSLTVCPVGTRALGDAFGEALAAEGFEVSKEVAQDAARRTCICIGRDADTAQFEASTYSAGDIFLDVSGSARTLPAEMTYFSAAEDGPLEGRNLPRLVLQVIAKCQPDVRRHIGHHIVVCGGGAMLPGLPKRLAQELQALYEDEALDKVLPKGMAEAARALNDAQSVYETPFQRSHLTWCGASIMSAFQATNEGEGLDIGVPMPALLELSAAELEEREGVVPDQYTEPQVRKSAGYP